jgi:hypothetical protein
MNNCKSIFCIVFYLAVIDSIHSQTQNFDFKAEFGTPNDMVTKIDSMSLSNKEFTARFYMYTRSDIALYNTDLLMYLKKKAHKEIYKKIANTRTSCCLYQNAEENMICFNIFTDALIELQDEDQEHPIICKMLVITLYQEKKKNIYFITSMKVTTK